MLDNFEDYGWVLDGGGVSVLRTRGVGGGGIFDSSGGDMSGSGSGDDRGTDSYTGDWCTGTGGARLVLFSCSRLVWVCKGITQTLIPDTLAVKPKASQSTDGDLL
jgi:hypothetical protein